MKHLLYVGNHLHSLQSNASYSAVLGSLLQQSGYEVLYTSSQRHKMRRLLEMLWITFKTRNITDGVLIDTYSTQNFYYAFLVSQLCRLLKLPYIPILHGGNLPNRLTSSPIMSSMIFKHAFCNVAPSNYLKKQFEAQGYHNLKYIPNTIVLRNYPFLRHRDFEHIKLLWVRSFSELYNPSMAVQVLKKLKELGIESSLCMVGPDSGDGSFEETKTLAEMLRLDVHFTGKLTKAEWIALSKDYTVFINTTTIDNMPVSVIEAMALGLPIVSTNVGGMPYLIESGTHGFLVENGAVDDMASAIAMLFKDASSRDEMVLNARKLAERFDWERVRLAWREVLD